MELMTVTESAPDPVWDLPSIFTVAEAADVSWAAFPDQGGYPTKFYKSLRSAPGTANVFPLNAFIPMAKAGTRTVSPSSAAHESRSSCSAAPFRTASIPNGTPMLPSRGR